MTGRIRALFFEDEDFEELRRVAEPIRKIGVAHVLGLILKRRISIDDGDWEGTLGEYLDANENLDEREIDAVASLSVGQELVIGGGAAATFKIRRVS